MIIMNISIVVREEQGGCHRQGGARSGRARASKHTGNILLLDLGPITYTAAHCRIICNPFLCAFLGV